MRRRVYNDLKVSGVKQLGKYLYTILLLQPTLDVSSHASCHAISVSNVNFLCEFVFVRTFEVLIFFHLEVIAFFVSYNEMSECRNNRTKTQVIINYHISKRSADWPGSQQKSLQSSLYPWRASSTHYTHTKFPHRKR